MNILGWILAVVGLVGLIFGLRMMLKGKKMGGVPFVKPADLAQRGAQAADAKGLVSTEGAAALPNPPLMAPMSGTPCIGYEITVERKWEKQVRTEKGHTTKTGTSKLHTEWRGSMFQLNDGQGTVLVDASTEPDTDLEKTHSSTITVGMMIPGMLTFGSMQMNTPAILSTDERTTHFVGTEKVLKASPTVYALGQLAQGPQGFAIGTPKGIGTGKLILSHQGRDHLMGKTKRNMILGYAIGGALFVIGMGLGIFGPKAAPSASTSCPSTITTDVSCDDRMYDADGKSYTFTVAAKATYTLSLQQPNVAHPIDGVLEVLDSAGKRVAYNDGGSSDTNASLTQELDAGTYTVKVYDFSHDKVEGGYGFHLNVAKSVAPAASASVATTESVHPALPQHHAGLPPVHSGATPAHSGAAPAPAHSGTTPAHH
jgi:uncharacterized protein YaiE (UPF0345 family)